MESLNVPWLIIGIVWVINFAISWWNARVCGTFWAELRTIGGWQRFMGWMGAIMSATGFTWCYLVVLLFGAYYAQPSLPFIFGEGPDYPIDHKALNAGFSLGYLLLIPGLLFSGLMIWINSLVEAWRRRDAVSIGVAGWNTFAQIHNTYSAIRGVPGAWESVKDFFTSGDSSDSDGDDVKSKAIGIILVLVALAVAGGIFTTWGLITHYAGTRPVPQRSLTRT